MCVCHRVTLTGSKIPNTGQPKSRLYLIGPLRNEVSLNFKGL